jgi:glycosyltransferase involved in cell wall biosynthesis
VSKLGNYKICIVIPAYNESSAIGDVVKDVKNTFANTHFDVVVVNDGSSDDTSIIAQHAGAIVINHVLNSGAGAATATGLSYAQAHGYDIAVTMDADGQHDPKDVLKGVSTAIKTGADLLIGSRLIYSHGMSRVKILGNKGLSLITRVLFGINVTDSQSGLRVFGEKALQELRWTTSGYEFCSEMLWRANQLNLTISEFPIKAIYTDYSKSKGQSNWNAINIVKSLTKQRIAEIFE